MDDDGPDALFDEPPLSTGIDGLDAILRGGLPPNQLYLVEGHPGTGKTTLALQFLREGARLGEAVLYVTLSETRRELLTVARSHGWDLAGVELYEMDVAEESLSSDQQLTMFHPSELELSALTDRVLQQVTALKPRRVVVDSLSELRLLAQGSWRYRRQILALKQFFASRDVTVLLLDDRAIPGEELQLQSIAHGVIRLDQLATEYGAERRQLRVIKLRGVQFRGGFHDFLIRRGGLDVFPRLVAAEHHAAFAESDLPSGLAPLDRLLGGGLAPGSSTLLSGPSGTGKSTLAIQFCIAAAARGQRCAAFLFDETTGMLRARARKLGMPLEEHLEAGLITLQQVEPAELSPGQFAAIIRRAVEGSDASGRPARVLLIDSLNGYLNSMSEEKQLTSQLHELFKFTNQQGVVTLVTLGQSGPAGFDASSPVETTYLADNVVLFRYFESFGQLRRAISMTKKRSGGHELTLRELRMGPGGIDIGEPLTGFQGVLTGVPTYHGKGSPPAGDAGS